MADAGPPSQLVIRHHRVILFVRLRYDPTELASHQSTAALPGQPLANAIDDMIGTLAGNAKYQELRTVPKQVHVQLSLW
jgi:hypothetical protein